MVRVRPMNNLEKSKSKFISIVRDCGNIVFVENDHHQITLKQPGNAKEPPRTFTFDYVFGTNCTQRAIYETSSFSLVESVIEGYNGKA
jgi:kinesin family protein 3/17